MKIVFIVLDALRYDHYRRYMTNLNRFANEAEDHYYNLSGGPYTKISLNNMLCGKQILEDSNLIQDLNKRGYETTLIFSSPILYEYQNLFTNSIDIFKETSGTITQIMQKRFHNALPWKVLRKHIIGLGYRSAETTTEYALTHLRKAPDDSFTWVHFMDPHIPYLPPDITEPKAFEEANRVNEKIRKNKFYSEGLTPDERIFLRQLYRMEVEYLDKVLEPFLAFLEADLIIITADHGDLLGEYGRFSHPHLWVPELLHVPLIIKGDSSPKAFQKWYSHYNLRKRILRSIPNTQGDLHSIEAPSDFCEKHAKEGSS